MQRLVYIVLVLVAGGQASAQAPPPLRVDDTGPAVEDLQRRLNARLSPAPDLDVDGSFGPATRDAVMRFQRTKGLKPTGVVDAATWEALGPTPPPEQEPPAPEIVNAQQPARAPADPLDGPPYVTAKGWVVVDGTTGTVLAGGDEAKPLEMASTTKLMTALVVGRLARRDARVLDEIVRFSERADKTLGSTAGVRAGEELPVRELLYGLLLPSGNDAATAFAEHFGARLAPPEGHSGASDSYSRFVAEMNRVAVELGLKETHFANPHGLSAAGHHASARDLAKLAMAVLSDPTCAAIVNTARHGHRLTTPEGTTRNVVWRNTNRLLGIEGYDGVKTGTTTAAGACLVASGRRGDRHVIVVVLGSASSDARYVDTRNLFRWAWSRR